MSYIPYMGEAVRGFCGRYNGISAKTIVTAMANKMHTAHMLANNV
jgi:hypothetical protein